MSRRVRVFLMSLAGSACVASAQTYEQGGARIEFQVFNTALAAWTSVVDAMPGQQVEWRMRVSYTGTRADLFAMGEVVCQPTIANTDNTDDTNGMDTLAPWRNGGVTGGGFPGTLLSTSEGENGAALPSYGRVNCGVVDTQPSSSNVITTFRHTNGSAGAPLGSYVRVAGNGVLLWPRDLSGPVPPLDVTASDIQSILRGVNMSEPAATVPIPSPGVTNKVTFRGAIVLSASADPRALLISTFRESLRRAGGATVNEPDDRRYVAWQTGIGDNGTGLLGHRTFNPEVIGATIIVVPAPGFFSVLIMFATSSQRRRRAQTGARP